MNLTVTLLIAIIILFALIYITAHHCRKLQEENNEIKIELEKQKAVVVEVYQHAQELAKIQQDKSEVNQKINEAQTNEEVNEIINSLIHANNERVRK